MTDTRDVTPLDERSRFLDVLAPGGRRAFFILTTFRTLDRISS